MVADASRPPEPTSEAAESLPRALAGLFADLPGLLTDRVHLLSLELRRASAALGQVLALALLAAILFATAWLTLWIGLAEAFLAVGLAWPWVVLLVLFVNLSAALWAVLRLKALAPLLALPATLRRLTDSDAAERHTEAEPHHV